MMAGRVFTTLAGVLCGIGWTGLGMIHSLPMLYTMYVVAGIGAALIYGGCMGSALKWFTDRRGLAAGIIAGAFGGGTALFVPFIGWSIRTQGYQQTFLWTGLFQGLVIVVVAQFMRHPAREAQTLAAARPASGGNLGSRHFTTGEMLRTPQFYVLYLMFVMMATGGLLVTANAGPMAATWGISVAALTLATSLNALANGASRIFWGWLSDKTGREPAMTIAFWARARYSSPEFSVT